MKQSIEIPAMGESISEVTIGNFLKAEGSFVQQNEEIVEIETDKVNQSLYAPASGKLSWKVKEGQVCPIGAVIGEVDTSEQGAAVAEPKKKTPPPEAPSKGETLRISEEEAVREPPKKAAELPPSATDREPLSPLRKTIARRLVESLHQTAMLTTFNEADLTQIIALRKTHQERFTKAYGVKLGFMSFFVQAVVSALRAFPLFNAYLDGDDVVHRQQIDIGIAVGTEKGLVVPVLRQADKLAIHEIEQQIAAYAEKARSGKITIADLQGGGFTITNGGVYGSLLSTPILNPPQVGILGMHKILERPVALNGQVAIRPMMYLALSYDHRLIDGQGAVSFLVHIKQALEEPATLLF